MSNGTLIADARTTGERLRLAGRPRMGEALIRAALVACGWFVLGTTIAMLGFLARTGIRGLSEVGVTSLFASDTWKPEAGSFGALALIVGTFTSALGAIAIGAAPAVLAAVWLTEFASDSVRRGYRRVLEIASAVPSVVYGWLALVYLVPVFENGALLRRYSLEEVRATSMKGLS